MATQSKRTDPLYPTGHMGDRALRISAENFARFDLWIDMELDELVSRYEPLYPPSTLRTALRTLTSPFDGSPQPKR